MSADNWLQRVPAQNPDLAWRMVDEECIIIDPQGSQATVLNPVGSRIWELVDGQRSLAAIMEKILEEYAVDRSQAEADTREFAEDLGKRKLITFDSQAG